MDVISSQQIRAPLAYDLIMRQPAQFIERTWTCRDTVLYNLGIGFGDAAVADARLLDYVLEERARAFPTMATVIGMLRPSVFDSSFNVDVAGILHGEEALQVFRPVSAEGVFACTTAIANIWDKGPGRGAVMKVERTVTDVRRGDLVATVHSTLFLRNNGGFGGSGQGAPQLAAMPETEPAGYYDIATRPDQCLVYRLSGDSNPLHVDPDTARRAGFPRPILMGLCSFALSARALVSACAEFDANRLRGLSARFTGVVFPGESIRVEYWPLGANEYAFRALVPERNVIVLNGGRVSFEP